MGRRGPPPQPTRLRLLRGNPGKRPINKKEPQPKVESPSCPGWLNAEAKRAWRALVPLLKDMQILALVDRDGLTAYCQTWARWKAAEEFLDTHGVVYPLRDEKGELRCMVQYPHVAIARNALQALRAYQAEFGMSPAARTRVHEIPKVATDPDEKRFFGPTPPAPTKNWPA